MTPPVVPVSCLHQTRRVGNSKLGMPGIAQSFNVIKVIYIYICIHLRYCRIEKYINTCIYVYMYICIYVYMYICIYVYMYICIYVYMYISCYYLSVERICKKA